MKKPAASFLLSRKDTENLDYLCGLSGQSGTEALQSALDLCNESLEHETKGYFTSILYRFKPVTNENMRERLTLRYTHAAELVKFEKQAAPGVTTQGFHASDRMKQGIAGVRAALPLLKDDSEAVAYALHFTAERVREMREQQKIGKSRICLMHESHLKRKILKTPYDRKLSNAFRKAARLVRKQALKLDQRLKNPGL